MRLINRVILIGLTLNAILTCCLLYGDTWLVFENYVAYYWNFKSALQESD